MTSRRIGACATALAAVLLLAAVVRPLQAQQPSGAMQGMQLQRDQPVKIESDTLEVRDKQRQATFSGSVKLTQGETTITCKLLIVFYEDGAAPAPAKKDGAATAQKGGGAVGGQQIKNVEAKGDVVIIQKDQTAKGDRALFDVKSNNVTLFGNVVITQGQNVLRGDRMTVDLTTGVARVESGQSKGGPPQRVEGLFSPGAPPAAAKGAPAPAPAPAPSKASPAAKSSPGAPTRINAIAPPARVGSAKSSKKLPSANALQDGRDRAKVASVQIVER